MCRPLNNRNQDYKASAPIIHFATRDSGGEAIADLSNAYASSGASKVQRGVALLSGRERYLIVDEISANAAVNVVWSMHTKATMTLTSGAKKATFSQGGKTIEAVLLSPEEASFSVAEVTLDSPQYPATGVRKLQVKGVYSSAARIIVLLAPSGAMTSSVTVNPLSEWKIKGPIAQK